MSKNKNDGRGRPRKELNYPKTGKFTVNTLVPMNPNILCRLTLYTRVKELTKGDNKAIRYTGSKIKTGGVGKPLFEFQSMAAFRAARAKRQTRKANKLETVTVDLTPAPVEVNA